MTLQLLCLEYKEAHPDGLQYSRFCESYRDWRGGLDRVLRQEHQAGEKAFADFAGQTVPIIDRARRDPLDAEIFVGVLGASNFTYAEASRSQELPGVDQRAHAHDGVLRWRAAGGRAGQSEERGPPRLLLRARVRVLAWRGAHA